ARLHRRSNSYIPLGRRKRRLANPRARVQQSLDLRPTKMRNPPPLSMPSRGTMKLHRLRLKKRFPRRLRKKSDTGSSLAKVTTTNRSLSKSLERKKGKTSYQ